VPILRALLEDRDEPAAAEIAEGENVAVLLGVVVVVAVVRLKPAKTGAGVAGVEGLVGTVKPPKEARGMAGTDALGVSISKDESGPWPLLLSSSE
jgi:hypothetical protein